MFTDAELNAKLAASTGDASPVRIAKDVPVRGFVFGMDTGLLSEVEAESA
ncbi:MAG TPA: hypothetical protein VK841_16330 [Polyangiaceae bacterium]|jgi:hypothetical protein|nr:hypothetical protein [Polyangiaceae bacterium]